MNTVLCIILHSSTIKKELACVCIWMSMYMSYMCVRVCVCVCHSDFILYFAFIANTQKNIHKPSSPTHAHFSLPILGPPTLHPSASVSLTYLYSVQRIFCLQREMGRHVYGWLLPPSLSIYLDPLRIANAFLDIAFVWLVLRSFKGVRGKQQRLLDLCCTTLIY